MADLIAGAFLVIASLSWLTWATVHHIARERQAAEDSALLAEAITAVTGSETPVHDWLAIQYQFMEIRALPETQGRAS